MFGIKNKKREKNFWSVIKGHIDIMLKLTELLKLTVTKVEPGFKLSEICGEWHSTKNDSVIKIDRTIEDDNQYTVSFGDSIRGIDISIPSSPICVYRNFYFFTLLGNAIFIEMDAPDKISLHGDMGHFLQLVKNQFKYVKSENKQ